MIDIRQSPDRDYENPFALVWWIMYLLGKDMFVKWFENENNISQGLVNYVTKMLTECLRVRKYAKFALFG